MTEVQIHGVEVVVEVVVVVVVVVVVDNLYRGYKRSRSLQNSYYNTPLVHWTHERMPHTGTLT